MYPTVTANYDDCDEQTTDDRRPTDDRRRRTLHSGWARSNSDPPIACPALPCAASLRPPTSKGHTLSSPWILLTKVPAPPSPSLTLPRLQAPPIKPSAITNANDPSNATLGRPQHSLHSTPLHCSHRHALTLTHTHTPRPASLVGVPSDSLPQHTYTIISIKGSHSRHVAKRKAIMISTPADQIVIWQFRFWVHVPFSRPSTSHRALRGTCPSSQLTCCGIKAKPHRWRKVVPDAQAATCKSRK